MQPDHLAEINLFILSSPPPNGKYLRKSKQQVTAMKIVAGTRFMTYLL